MLLILIPLAWFGVATMLLCLCRMAAMADRARGGDLRRAGRLHAEVIELRRVPIATLAGRRLRAHSDRRTPRASARARLTAIHSSR
jgi:hypothetical protein